MNEQATNLIELVRTLAATAYGTNRMVLAIVLEVNKNDPAAQRLDEIQILAGRCFDLLRQIDDAMECAKRLSESDIPPGEDFDGAVHAYIARVKDVHRYFPIDYVWTEKSSRQDLEQMKVLGATLYEEFGNIRQELLHLDRPKEVSSATQMSVRMRPRKISFMRWSATS